MSGSTRRTPGPLTPVNRPSVNITPRSYSFRTRIELMASSSNTTTMMGSERLIGDSFLILWRFPPERQPHDFDYTRLLPRSQRTGGAGVPQFSPIAHDALILAVSDCFNQRADHGLDSGAQGPAWRTGCRPPNDDDDEPARNRDSHDQRQRHPQSRCTIVE